MINAVSISGTSVLFYEIAKSIISRDSHLFTCSYENLKSHGIKSLFVFSERQNFNLCIDSFYICISKAGPILVRFLVAWLVLRVEFYYAGLFPSFMKVVTSSE